MLAVAVLAAGKGTRMKSTLPKVLQKLGGKTLLERVLTNCNRLNPDRSLIIVGHQADEVKESLTHIQDLEFVNQVPQNGTGHAVMQLEKSLTGFKGELLLLNGDVPLLNPETLERLVSTHKSLGANATLLTAKIKDPKGYGRVFTNKQNLVTEIIEDRDCTVTQKENNLINSGIYCFDWESLKKVLPSLNSNNNQGELYITDAISMLANSRHIEVDDPSEVNGINDHQQLSECETYLQERLRDHWMREGVKFIDPKSCTLSEFCQIGKDVVIEAQTHIRGRCQIGNHCEIGPNTLLENAIIGDRVKILFSVVRESTIKNDACIGPFSHVRPESIIGEKCRIGNFVEVKKSYIGSSSKVNHLSYIGDAKLGQLVNIGAGTITANYDGQNKHQTIIGDSTKTGSNSVLVAPIILGKNVTVGAGSTLTKNVPDNALAISRSGQLIKENWVKLHSNHQD